MRNLLAYSLVIFLLSIYSCEEPPESTVSIAGAFPSSNPVGGPVKIVGEGFTNETELFFNGNLATIEQRSDTFLTTWVPTGTNGVGVSIRVEDPGGTDELKDYFDVLLEYPANIPQSPPNIIIPTGALTSAMPFSVSGANFVDHVNLFDPNHQMSFMYYRQSDDFVEYYSHESFWQDSVYYNSQLTTDGNEFFSYNDTTKEAELSSVEVDRAMSTPGPHPFVSDEYTAQYFRMEDFVIPMGFINSLGGDPEMTDNFLLLESKTSGRQYLFVVFCRYIPDCGW